MRKPVDELTEQEMFSLAVAAGARVTSELIGNKLVFTTEPIAIIDDGRGYVVAIRRDDKCTPSTPP